ncbi:Uncharacterised protein [Lysinibacillus capsici]|uniref:Uncharacterized protein n=1 Tax=Lysinibacillus capsici TaxID=2115968 RepID=A0A2X1A6S7_9BACI|nr:hypothetical protein [Lysinibacillus capsici]SPU40703.1 Uncharacterised protein [Lysinibacillus capsici]
MKKKVSIQLKNIHLPVSINESMVSQISKEELKKLLIAQIKDALTDPIEAKASLTVEKATVFEDGQLFKHEIYPGRVVRTVHNEMGIVTGVKDKKVDGEKEVSVILPGHRIWYFSFDELYETAATFSVSRCIRLEFSRKELIWHEGDSAYLKVPNGNLVPVIVGKSSRGKTLLHEVNNTSNKTKSWSVARISLNQVLTEFKDEQERHQYISSEQLIESFKKYSDKEEFQFQKKGLSRQEQLKNIVTLFQNEMFELQPTLFARANDSVKEFIKQNQQKCLDILATLTNSRKELVQEDNANLNTPESDSVYQVVKSSSRPTFLHEVEHTSFKKKQSLLARITLNQVYQLPQKGLPHQEQLEIIVMLFGNAKFELQPSFSVREIESVKDVFIQTKLKYLDIIEKLNNSRKELLRHEGDSAYLKVPISVLLPLTNTTARGTPAKQLQQRHILPKNLFDQFLNKPIKQLMKNELTPHDQMKKVKLFDNEILRMHPVLSMRAHGT